MQSILATGYRVPGAGFLGLLAYDLKRERGEVSEHIPCLDEMTCWSEGPPVVLCGTVLGCRWAGGPGSTGKGGELLTGAMTATHPRNGAHCAPWTSPSYEEGATIWF